MYRLVAFAYRDKPPLEYLDQHLYEVSIYMYPLLINKRPSIKFIGILAGILHDIGKSIDIYQKCILYNPETKACSYTGHEVFSALLTIKIIDIDSIPLNIVKDLATFLSCNDDDAKKALIKVIAISIISHHQAMGSPYDRLESFIYRITKKYRSTKLEVCRSVIEVIEEAIKRAKEVLQEDYLYIKLDPKGIDYVEELCNNALREGRQQIIDRILSELRKALALPSETYSEKLILLEKFITGSLIIADLYIAGLRRGETISRPLFNYLNKMYRYYSSTYLPQPINT